VSRGGQGCQQAQGKSIRTSHDEGVDGGLARAGAALHPHDARARLFVDAFDLVEAADGPEQPAEEMARSYDWIDIRSQVPGSGVASPPLDAPMNDSCKRPRRQNQDKKKNKISNREHLRYCLFDI
jgi:hypothetical protein